MTLSHGESRRMLDGVHWPGSTAHLLRRLPRDLTDVPLVSEISRRVNTDPLRISDVWSAREWHSKPIYSDLYRPNGGEFQLVLPMSFAGPASTGAAGRRVESLTLMRGDRDFSDHDCELLVEFGRHVRNVARHLRRNVFAPTIENHLQAAYASLGVSNRTAALSRISAGPGGRFAVGEIPY